MADIYTVRITVISQEGHCAEGHKVGDQWVIGKEIKTPSGMCAHAFTSLFPAIQVLQFGGVFPWLERKGTPDVCEVACPDAHNPMVFEVRRLRE